MILDSGREGNDEEEKIANFLRKKAKTFLWSSRTGREMA